MKYLNYILLLIISILLLSGCDILRSDSGNTDYDQAIVEYTGSTKYEEAYQFKVIESKDVIYNVIEIKTGDFTPDLDKTYCMNLIQIQLRDYEMVSFCD